MIIVTAKSLNLKLYYVMQTTIIYSNNDDVMSSMYIPYLLDQILLSVSHRSRYVTATLIVLEEIVAALEC